MTNSSNEEESKQDSEVVVEPEEYSFIQKEKNQNGATDIGAALEPESRNRLVDGAPTNPEPSVFTGLKAISSRIFPYGFATSTLVSQLNLNLF